MPAFRQGFLTLNGSECGNQTSKPPFVRCLNVFSKLKLKHDEVHGANIVLRSLEEPIRQITCNAGVDGSIFVEKVKEKEGAWGWSAQAGIMAPTKVARLAIQNAASVASLLLTTEALIAEKPQDKKAAAGMASPGGMAGMVDMDY